MEREGELVRIKGIIIPVDWDAEGNVTRAAISAFNEEEYVVDEDKKGKEMLGLMQQVMEARGVVREEAGTTIITRRRVSAKQTGRPLRIKQRGGNENGGSSQLA